VVRGQEIVRRTDPRCGFMTELRGKIEYARVEPPKPFFQGGPILEPLPPAARKHRPSRRVPVQHIARAKKRHCPTCREPLISSRDAWSCINGCTNEARAG
jgi:hypothetical protein